MIEQYGDIYSFRKILEAITLLYHPILLEVLKEKSEYSRCVFEKFMGCVNLKEEVKRYILNHNIDIYPTQKEYPHNTYTGERNLIFIPYDRIANENLVEIIIYEMFHFVVNSRTENNLQTHLHEILSDKIKKNTVGKNLQQHENQYQEYIIFIIEGLIEYLTSSCIKTQNLVF